MLQEALAAKAERHFNPTLVQLELVGDCIRVRLLGHFNPTLVQLESEQLRLF